MCQEKIIRTDWMGFSAGDAYLAAAEHALPVRSYDVRWLGLQVVQGAPANVFSVKHNGLERFRMDGVSPHLEQVLLPITDGGEGWTVSASVGGGLLVTYYRSTPR